MLYYSLKFEEETPKGGTKEINGGVHTHTEIEHCASGQNTHMKK